MTHELKTLSCYFSKVITGEKTFEVRKNDRDFNLHDDLILKEIDMLGNYTGREVKKTVTYILDAREYVKEGYVILAIN
jgi:hypothetical protein